MAPKLLAVSKVPNMQYFVFTKRPLFSHLDFIKIKGQYITTCHTFIWKWTWKNHKQKHQLANVLARRRFTFREIAYPGGCPRRGNWFPPPRFTPNHPALALDRDFITWRIFSSMWLGSAIMEGVVAARTKRKSTACRRATIIAAWWWTKRNCNLEG